ncbi:zinc finger protein 182-like [Colias croceus]|uniref:zinc finger protein 182-like n=1 Tax=Colias crocea TaxID=72248 RepID=UPI001E27A56D|nr:zinc finger protein 182-like [Colias croceus]
MGERCCRLCAKEKETTIMIFGAEAASMQLQNKMNKYLLIEIERDDNLPKSICIECCRQLQNVCEFIDLARNAQETLLKLSMELYDRTDEDISISQTNPDMTRISTKQNVVIGKKDSTEITYLNSADGENVTITRLYYNNPTLKVDDENTDAQKPFPCKSCHRKFLSEIALKNHMWSHLSPGEAGKPYTCTICDKAFEFKTEFMTHIKQHNGTRKCAMCKRSFRSEKNLNAHMTIHFSNKKLYTCNKCGRSYATRSTFRNHNISHSNERPHHCTMCKKSFKRFQELRFHMNKHTGAKPFKCPVCNKGFASSGNCYAHKSRMHPTATVQESSKNRKKQTEVSVFSESLYLRPIAPKEKTDKTTNGPFKYQCQLCSHTFNKKDNFTYHMYKHTGIKPFHCIHCTEKFVTRRGLYLHYEKYHPGKDRPLGLFSKNVQLK